MWSGRWVGKEQISQVEGSFMGEIDEQLERLVTAVLASGKYKYVGRDLIRSVGVQELARRRNMKEALKATKNKLHQVGGVYLERREDYGAWSDDLRRAAQVDGSSELQQVCRRIMRRHTSTRERLPILELFYTTVLAGLPPVHSVLDVACGLNPLVLSWLPLSESVEYYACDIYQDMVDFLREFMLLLPVQGDAWVCDLTQSCPTKKVDVAFVLKCIPCLEQVDKAAGYRLLHTLNADHLVVSFPVQSLGGRGKGMVANYEARFRELVADTSWLIKRFEFATELVFLVMK
jgi:16S rRNA (guanine(1405)-N(7))-methyltransferase